MMINTDILIIGAGPSGSIAGKLLRQKGYDVTIVERSSFPRFSIGESLLPQAMQFIEEAGMSDDIKKHCFQYKDGAVFLRNDNKVVFDFHHKFSDGPETTFQVQRADFDKILADNAEDAGVTINYQEEVLDVDVSIDKPVVKTRDVNGNTKTYQARFLLDASGFGRVLPRLLELERPSDFPVRQSLFTHIEDNISDPEYDRTKIVIAIHPEHQDVWYWLIPFSNGRCSLGVVAEESYLSNYTGSNEERIKKIVAECLPLNKLLNNAVYDTPVNQITGYSANVTQLHGNRYLLLGNAGEFLDPVFSSGVTIAMKSASLAAELIDRDFKGQEVNWAQDYAQALQKGVNVFKTYVSGWYDGRFQDIIFNAKPMPEVKSMICSILAGYTWDEKNPYVQQSERRFNVLAELCKSS